MQTHKAVPAFTIQHCIANKCQLLVGLENSQDQRFKTKTKTAVSRITRLELCPEWSTSSACCRWLCPSSRPCRRPPSRCRPVPSARPSTRRPAPRPTVCARSLTRSSAVDCPPCPRLTSAPPTADAEPSGPCTSPAGTPSALIQPRPFL